jgi:hypothetical protein
MGQRYHRGRHDLRVPEALAQGALVAASGDALEMALATCTDRNAPTKFNTPASSTATFGRNAPVAIEVAIAFAVSWNPLVKSNSSAVTTTAGTMTDMPILQNLSVISGTLANTLLRGPRLAAVAGGPLRSRPDSSHGQLSSNQAPLAPG